ncbi:hypothetical protein MC885_008391 [Smutsia gigantea]|nr:hypothetical protein MC885_008391 [Smutsia gigantea]
MAMGPVPVTLGTVSFTRAGIVASCIEAEVMSAVAITSGSEVVAGSLVATLQSMGLTLSSNAALGQSVPTLGSRLGVLNGSSLLGAPAAALPSFSVGDPLKPPSLTPCVWASIPHHPPLNSSSPVAAIAVRAVPVVLGTLGFTSAGIAASSIAAKTMSVAAISNGGGVAAGSLVATLQTVRAAGLSMSSKVLLGSAGSALVPRVLGL